MVLNGADGMEDMLGKALTMGGAGLGLAQSLMSSIRTGAVEDGAHTNGTRPGAEPAPDPLT